MSDLYCPKCKQFTLYPETHVCPPEWEVCFGDNIDQAINYGILVVNARDITEAVESAAEDEDCHSGEYSIVRNGESKAWARPNGHTEWSELIVYGESVPQYTAYEVKRNDQ